MERRPSGGLPVGHWISDKHLTAHETRHIVLACLPIRNNLKIPHLVVLIDVDQFGKQRLAGQYIPANGVQCAVDSDGNRTGEHFLKYVELLLETLVLGYPEQSNTMTSELVGEFWTPG